LGKTVDTEKQWYRHKNKEAKTNAKVSLMPFVTVHRVFSKGMSTGCTTMIFSPDYCATCFMRGFLDSMFNIEQHFTNIMVGYNERISSESFAN
jgi:hypothetical protein